MKLFPGQWDDLVYGEPEDFDQATNRKPMTGKRVRKICVSCELTRRILWEEKNGP